MIENMSSDSLYVEYPSYKRSEFDEFIAEVFGQCSEELDFICFEDVGLGYL
jgi:hypothetical protein